MVTIDAVVADDDAVAGALGAEDIGGEGVGRNDGRIATTADRAAPRS